MPLTWLGATVALSSAAAGVLLGNRFPVGTNPRWVAVADIGQGNCNVVFDDNGRPIMYYDLGGGVLANAFTYPVPQPTFCYDVGHCLFVVSHWDRDHYQTLSIATNNAQLNNVHVLVPQQQAGASVTTKGTAGAMIGRIIVAPVNATLHAWRHEDPNALSGNYVAASGLFAVIKVTGNDVNNTGLAVRLEDPALPGRYMLLTGDATFQNAGHVSFPHNTDQHCVGLVAGHHGAAVESLPDAPRPEPGAASYLIAYSFGWGNDHGHPRVAGGVSAYDGRGWVDDHRMDTGGAELAARYAGPRGNVGLLWPGAVPGPGNAVPGLAPAAVDAAAIALLAAAAAEVGVAAVGLPAAGAATWHQVAAGAVFQAAAECGAPAVAAALTVPANGVALAAVAAAAPPVLPLAPAVDPALAGAIAAAPAAAVLAGGPGRQALATAVTDMVMLAFARAAQILTAAAVGAAAGAGPHIGDQAKAAAEAAHDDAADQATVDEAAAAIPADFVQRALAAANAVSAANVPTAAELVAAVAEATCDGVRGRLGRPGAGNNSQPPYTAAQAAAAAPAVAALARDDIATAIAAAVGCVPAVPVNPGSAAPKTVVVNENAKIAARVAAVAALCAPPIAGPVTRGQVGAAAVAAARVVLPAAQGAPQVGCHRHPRTCGQPACSLSLHYFYGMFPARITTAAGNGHNAYAGENVPAIAAGLAGPQAVIQDAQFNTYVCDAAANRVRRISSGGVIATLAGTGAGAHGGDANAPAIAAQLDAPAAVAVDETRNLLYVADRARNRVRRVDLSTGQISAFAGTGAPGVVGDGGPAAAAQLSAPEGLAYDHSRDVLYIADTGSHRVRVVDPATGIITTVAGTGAAGDGPDGPATACALHGPTGLYADADGDLYIADTGNHRVRVLTGGDIAVIAGLGAAAGAAFAGIGIPAVNAQFSQPRGVAVDAAGVVYIADTGNRRVRRVDPGTHLVTTIAGTGAAGSAGDGALAAMATFQAPAGLAMTAAGDLCVADPLAFCVRQITLGTGVITRVAGAGGAGHAAGPVALPGQLTAPQQVTCTAAGAVVIADSGAHTVSRADAGLLADVAGDGNPGDGGDGAAPAANAGLSAPAGLALDRGTRTLYFSDSGSHCVRQVDLATGTVSRLAGQPNAAGGGGDNAAAIAAHLSNPGALAFDDATRVLYICDRGNNRVRAVELATGTITAAAGAGAPAAAGGALNQPSAIALDFDGNLYVATAGDHRVRRVNVTTNAIAGTVGTGVAGDLGDNGPLAGVQLHTPVGLAVDGAKVIYVSCAGTNRVRCLDQDADRAYALAGDGNAGFLGDGGLPPQARLTGPRGLYADEAGRNLLIADTGNFRVRHCRL